MLIRSTDSFYLSCPTRSKIDKKNARQADLSYLDLARVPLTTDPVIAESLRTNLLHEVQALHRRTFEVGEQVLHKIGVFVGMVSVLGGYNGFRRLY